MVTVRTARQHPLATMLTIYLHYILLIGNAEAILQCNAVVEGESFPAREVKSKTETLMGQEVTEFVAWTALSSTQKSYFVQDVRA